MKLNFKTFVSTFCGPSGVENGNQVALRTVKKGTRFQQTIALTAEKLKIRSFALFCKIAKRYYCLQW